MVKQLSYALLMMTCLFSHISLTYGQDEFSVVLGAGETELVHIGFFSQVERTQFGLSIGTIPFTSDKRNLSISKDIYYHFGKTSKLSDRHLWFVRTGLTYLRRENEELNGKYLRLNVRIGKDIHFSRKIWLSLDLGFASTLYHNVIRFNPKFLDLFHGDTMFLRPGLNMRFFFRT